MKTYSILWRGIFSGLGLCLCLFVNANDDRPAVEPPGHPPRPQGFHSFIGANVVVSPSLTISNATLVINKGKVVSVIQSAEAAPGSRTWDMEGFTIYPGFIDPYYVLSTDDSPVTTTRTIDDGHANHQATGHWNFYGMPGDELDPGAKGPGSSLSTVHPEYSVMDKWVFKSSQRKELRNLGFTAVHLSPSKGIFRGTGAVSLTGESSPNQLIQHSEGFQHIAFSGRDGKDSEFPKSLMGVISTIRQTILEAQDHLREKSENLDGLYNPSLDALEPLLNGIKMVLIEPGSVLMSARASSLAESFGIRYGLIASGQEWRRPDLIKQIDAPFIVPVNFPEIPKLPEDDDWDALSLDLLRHWDWAPETPALLASQGHRLALTLYSLNDRKEFRKKLKQAIERGLPKQSAIAALTTVPAELCGLSDSMGTLVAGKQANFTIIKGDDYFLPDNPVESTWVQGARYPNDQFDSSVEKDHKESETKAEDEPIERLARSPLEDHPSQVRPDTLLVKNATIWTSSSSGIIEQADLLIQHGHILDVGENLSLPDSDLGSCLVIDATGKHLTPGLIDAHSHSMIMGGVNEGTMPSTAMVRIADVVNSETDNIYYQLAGGLTIANLLHGSANPIGGQNAIIKLRWGKGPDDLIFKEAPGGIKFALGENVKQANWGDEKKTRFPQTRMGVPVFYENRFTAAQHYQEAWRKFEFGSGKRPKRNLEMDCLVEILEGKRWIHCHSYRQDEILAFLRVMENFGIQVGTLQHVLEGYKIADEIAEHGAGASCFTDWWAYKFEVIDAIPYAGSLMHERGALVSFNSDDSDLARRMYLEAAKAVKYGNTPPEAALNFVTRYPAQQLRIDHLVGSLEKGKHGDFVLWSGSPLNSGSTCLETWIEGVKYFDRHTDSDRTQARALEKKALLEKAKKIAKYKSEKEDSESEEEKEQKWILFFQQALEKQDEGRILHCDD
ncbi:MAG: amidohydrolase family protein [Verrucomicrobia bacterium]|jgi:imidazolonepropionase-like amidohydrolase|nr:amidohydrolase family protein [Verrucomicrobiota bacterium]